MIAIAVWLLLAVSDGAYNRGTTVTIAQLPSEEACVELKTNIEKQIHKNRADYICVAATVATYGETK